MKGTVKKFTGQSPTWCPGCGDWAIGAAIKRALVGIGHDPSSVMMSFGIGCSGNMNDFVNAYAYHGLHGRALPIAIGMKMANHTMPVLCIVGDGDCYGEGGNHFLHACRGNHDITVVVHDNSVYGLTTGQVSPRAPKGFKSKSTPSGTLDLPLNPLTLSLTQGATFIAQGFAGQVQNLIGLLQQGIQHKGFALINVLQPCVTFNKLNTYEYYRDKTYDLPGTYDPSDFKKALNRAIEPTYSEKFPLGVLYQVERPSYTEQIPQISKKPLIQKKRFKKIGELIRNFE
jgi:2-oxoglutarate/2-oxoacid ferredoxin oxidoreductase subunit beta